MFALIGSDTIMLHSSQGVIFLHTQLLQMASGPSSHAEDQQQHQALGLASDPAETVATLQSFLTGALQLQCSFSVTRVTAPSSCCKALTKESLSAAVYMQMLPDMPKRFVQTFQRKPHSQVSRELTAAASKGGAIQQGSNLL